MRTLDVLRPVQMVDVGFQLLRYNFVRSFAVGLAVTIPLQSIVWIVELAVGNSDESYVAAGTIYIAFVMQFFAIGTALCVVSSILGATVGKTYARKMFGTFEVQSSISTRATIALWQVFIQVVFLLLAIGSRWFLGQTMPQDYVDLFSYMGLLFLFPFWVIVTIRVGFAIPASIHEQISFSVLRKRTRALNRKGFMTLFGVYWLCVTLIFALITPSLMIGSSIIANNVGNTEVGSLAMFNMFLSFIVALISVVYSYVLTVVYFNTRIQYEGFDIALSIAELEEERSRRGKLLNAVTR
jgi:hypothetical protein